MKEQVKTPVRTEHLSAEEVAAYRDGGLAVSDRAWADRHLAHCLSCRNEMIEVERYLTARRRRGQAWGATVAGGLVAAALIGLVLLRGIDSEPEFDRLREGEEGLATIERITPVGPVGAAELPVRFTWTSETPDAFYRFALLAEDGAELYSTGIRDTSVTLPDSITLFPQSTYHWYVDAVLPNGRSITTGLQSFEIRGSS
jgi:hypothetical protein